MMIKKLHILLILLTINISIEARTVKGKVTDKNLQAVEYATVILQSADSVFINAVYTDSAGVFGFSADNTEFRLIVQHLQYETFEKTFSGEFDLTVELQERTNALDEIVIKGEKPVVQLIDGKLTYDVPLLISGKAVSSAYESLLQLPGVSEQNGLPTLAGTSSVTVIINGKVTSMPVENLMAALKMYPANMLKNAEIMYSAPPQYHVRGAVINLILKENSSGDRLQGQINTAYTQKHYGNGNAGVSLLFSEAKLSADLNYAFNRNQKKSGVDLYSSHFYDGETHNINQLNDGYRKSNAHHLRLGADYKIAENDKINLVYTSQITANMDNNEVSQGSFSNSVNRKTNESPVGLHNVSADYSAGFGLTAGIEYTSYKNLTTQHFTETMTGKEKEFIAAAQQEIRRYRVFADQSHSIADWTLNYGAQYLSATDKSSQNYRTSSGNDLSDLDISNNIKEYSSNAYLGFEKSFGEKLSISASITGEYYKLGDSDEWTLFPALEAVCFISPSQIVQLSLSSDKVYPSYWEMHGAVGYLNGYSEIHGNPSLKPYNDYSGQLTYILNNMYILTVYYNYLDKYSMQLPYQSPDRLALIYKTLNFNYKQRAGINLIIPFKAGEILSSRLTLNGFYDRVKCSNFHDISVLNDNFVFYAKLDNTVKLSSKPDIKLEISGSYISKNIQGPAELSALWNLDAGLKWSFFHNLAELRLKGTDLLNSWTPDMKMKFSTQNLTMNLIPDSRAVSLSFTFKFGGFDKKYEKIDDSRFGTK